MGIDHKDIAESVDGWNCARVPQPDMFKLPQQRRHPTSTICSTTASVINPRAARGVPQRPSGALSSDKDKIFPATDPLTSGHAP